MSHFCINCKHHKSGLTFRPGALLPSFVHVCARTERKISPVTGKKSPQKLLRCVDNDWGNCSAFVAIHDPDSPDARCLNCALHVESLLGNHYCTLCDSTDGVIETINDLGGCDNYLPRRTWWERVLDQINHWWS